MEHKIVAVTKGRTVQEMEKLFSRGYRVFGENRIEEALEKKAHFPAAEFHFIGKLQSKKVPKAIGAFTLIHSVDTPELAELIAKKSSERNLTTHILLQANCSGESTKQGLTPSEWERALPPLLLLKGISIDGFMTMAPLTEDRVLIRKTFRTLRELKEHSEKITGAHFPHLSMGMSNDWEIAKEEGATLLRIGEALFRGDKELF